MTATLSKYGYVLDLHLRHLRPYAICNYVLGFQQSCVLVILVLTLCSGKKKLEWPRSERSSRGGETMPTTT